MKTIAELLTSLARPEVIEFGLVTNRLPSVNVGGKFEPVDDVAPSSERVLEMLTAVGGSRHVETLGDKPAQWTTRVDGIGVIAVAAIRREEIVQARFTVTKREASAAPAPPALSTPPAPRPSLPIPRVGAPLQPQPPKSVPPRPSGFSKPPPGRPSQASAVPVSDRVVVARPAPPTAPPPSGPTELTETPTIPVPPTPPASAADSRWDDDEPTLQTILPSPTGAVPTAAMPRAVPTPTSVEVVAVLPPRDRDSDTGAISALVELTADEDSIRGPLPRRSSPPSTSSPPIPAAVQAPKASLDATMPLDAFLSIAVSTTATDLYLVAGQPVRLRISSKLVARGEPMTAEHAERLAREIVPGRLRETLEREGACDFAVEQPMHGRFRVNVARQQGGYKLAFRVVPRTVPTLRSLGLPAILSNVVRIERGIVLVSGRRGSGKSSTVAAFVEHIARETSRHVMTIEDPIEFVHPRAKGLVSQRELTQHSSTRERAFETALGADVDTLVVDEVRDAVAARAALVAAGGGRLVLATSTAPTVRKAIERFIELFPSAEQSWAAESLARSLVLVVAQELALTADGQRLRASVELLPSSEAVASSIRERRTESLVGHRSSANPGSEG